jgi:hypothetical protein
LIAQFGSAELLTQLFMQVAFFETQSPPPPVGVLPAAATSAGCPAAANKAAQRITLRRAMNIFHFYVGV